MKVNNPMVMLRDMAQEKLTETTRALGSVQQTLMAAVAQHEQLQHYEREYQQSLRQGLLGSGMSMADLVNQQSFILSLNRGEAARITCFHLRTSRGSGQREVATEKAAP